MYNLVLFKDLSEDEPVEEYGILLEDDTILCLCCGGISDNYEILERPTTDINISTLLKEELRG